MSSRRCSLGSAVGVGVALGLSVSSAAPAASTTCVHASGAPDLCRTGTISAAAFVTDGFRYVVYSSVGDKFEVIDERRARRRTRALSTRCDVEDATDGVALVRCIPSRGPDVFSQLDLAGWQLSPLPALAGRPDLVPLFLGRNWIQCAPVDTVDQVTFVNRRTAAVRVFAGDATTITRDIDLPGLPPRAPTEVATPGSGRRRNGIDTISVVSRAGRVRRLRLADSVHSVQYSAGWITWTTGQSARAYWAVHAYSLKHRRSYTWRFLAPPTARAPIESLDAMHTSHTLYVRIPIAGRGDEQPASRYTLYTGRMPH